MCTIIRFKKIISSNCAHWIKVEKKYFFQKGAHLIKNKKKFNKKVFPALWNGTIKILQLDSLLNKDERKENLFCCELLCSWISYFKSFWDAPIDSILSAKHEDDPQSLVHDKYAIALINSESVTVGHLPKFMLELAHFCVKHAGKIGVKLQVQKDTFPI